MPQNHMTKYFCEAKEHGVQWQLNRSYSLTCTPGHVAAQFNWHGNCTTGAEVLPSCLRSWDHCRTYHFLCLAVLRIEWNIVEGVVVVLRLETSHAAAHGWLVYRSSSLPSSVWTPKYVQALVLLYSNLYVTTVWSCL